MKVNSVILALLLVVCALTTQQLLRAEQAKTTLVVELLPQGPDGSEVVLTQEIQDRVIKVLSRRLDPDNSKNVLVKSESLQRLLLTVPADTDFQEAQALLEQIGQLEFREQRYSAQKTDVEWVTRLNGSAIEHASATPDAMTGRWQVAVKFTTEGGIDFASLTKELLGKPLGIFFDGAEISAPIIQTAITGGEAVITGNFSEKEATELALVLNAGGLPVRVRLVPETES